MKIEKRKRLTDGAEKWAKRWNRRWPVKVAVPGDEEVEAFFAILPEDFAEVEKSTIKSDPDENSSLDINL